MSELKESFFDEIQSRVKKYSLATDFESISKYFGDKNGVVISTLHGVKGEEYTNGYCCWVIKRLSAPLGLYYESNKKIM